jgi:methylglyoxal synthase
VRQAVLVDLPSKEMTDLSNEMQTTGLSNSMQLSEKSSVRMPHVAIIAHDGKKADLVAFATFNRERLRRCHLIATGTTGRLLVEKVGLAVERVESGPHGGDVQIASRIVEGVVDAVLFIVDPLDKHPHDPDIQTLMRICNVRNVPLASNIATADIMICSPLLWTVETEGAEALVG